MNIQELADLLNLEIKITYYPNQNNRWPAKFVNTEIKKEEMLISEYGNGNSIHDALKDYTIRIRGQKLIINAMKENRQEFNVPINLEILPR